MSTDDNITAVKTLPPNAPDTAPAAVNGTAPPPPLLLTAPHWHMLTVDSAIAPDIVRERGYQSLPQPEDLIDRGFSKAQAKAAPALGLPRWNVHGVQDGWAIRPDNPRVMAKGRVAKYEIPKDDHLVLDIHPRCQPLLGDPTCPLLITEGTRKGDALASRGACAIALSGVWGFRGKNDHGGLTILPDWQHVALNGRQVIVAFDSDLASKPGVAAALRAFYVFLRSRQAIPSRVEWPGPLQQSKLGVDDYFAQGHTLEDLLALVPPPGPLPTSPPQGLNGTVTPPSAPVPSADEGYPYSDAYNAWCLVKAYGQDLRYCSPWKSWLVWTGTHWERDTTGQVLRWQRQTVKALGAQLSTLSDDAANALMGHIQRSLNTGRLEAAVRQAQSWEGISVAHDVFDADPWLLNCANGTLDLRTGTLQSHAQTDLITKCLPTPYTTDATCPTWERFLWRIMDGPQGNDDPATLGSDAAQTRNKAAARAQELIDFLQRAVGYTLTGSTREQCLFILHGPTKTGKSTFLATLRRLLGPYGMQADMNSFMRKDKEEVRNDLADMAGSRLVCALESQEGRRLNEALVKQCTGGVDHIKARFLFQEYFEFPPQFKVYLGTNHLPQIKDSDTAIWERIRRVPFIVQIPKKDRNKTLDDQLQQELPGILAWAVRGCGAWLRLGELQEPAAVVDATEHYRAEQDVLGTFFTECCLVGPQYRVSAADLFKAYQVWSGDTAIAQRSWGMQLTGRGLESRKVNGRAWWIGVALLDIPRKEAQSGGKGRPMVDEEAGDGLPGQVIEKQADTDGETNQVDEEAGDGLPGQVIEKQADIPQNVPQVDEGRRKDPYLALEFPSGGGGKGVFHLHRLHHLPMTLREVKRATRHQSHESAHLPLPRRGSMIPGVPPATRMSAIAPCPKGMGARCIAVRPAIPWLAGRRRPSPPAPSVGALSAGMTTACRVACWPQAEEVLP